ncbi:MAG: glycoside hydrolase family 65, partial [Nitrospiraceae bacterium]
RYHIRMVIGPDEYHEAVDDNAYTNVMAQWNLERGAETARLLQSRWPEHWRSLVERLNLKPETWQRITEAMETGFDPQTRLFEQFQGFFDLEEVDPAVLAKCTMPIDICLGREQTRRAKVIKQADVVAISALLWNRFPREVHERNFRYYEPRTAHGSSLSPAFHALVAARLGDLPLVERYFRQAAEIDLANNVGNATGGVHIAAMGGLWQAAVFGIAGMCLREDGLSFDPHLPQSWRKFSFSVQWHGRRLAVVMNRERRRIEVELHGNDPMTVEMVGGSVTVISPGHQCMAQWDGTARGAWQDSAL